MLDFLSYGSLKMAAYLNEDESDGEIRYIQFDGHCYDRKSVTLASQSSTMTSVFNQSDDVFL